MYNRFWGLNMACVCKYFLLDLLISYNHQKRNILKHKIKVNLGSNQDVLNTLDFLIENYDEIAKDSYSNSGLEFYDTTTHNLIELETVLHPEIPNYSELAFYLIVVEDKNNFEKIEKFNQTVIEKNARKSVWMNEEIQMGLSAAFALAFKDKSYIHNFVNVLRTFNLNNEVYEPFFIELLLKKWKTCDEALYLLAARSGSISGQWGIENYAVPSLDHEQKNKFITYLLNDALKAKAVYSDMLIDALHFLEINVDTETFESYFGPYNPLYNEKNIPNIRHLD